ncbi:thioredoxin domain-containing protein 15-like [Portunus trituberculatus]|uniref:thioredoxin domain-containing protein 15-like n=1 Tax=Portunus trituberculatus TaxID=210409 RepID=UPI001E1CF1F0|nr:thioredoxin domain-containing protein 15-like [Portunus trituberculatus]
MLQTRTFILLLVCITGAKSWQDSIEIADEHVAENTECLKNKGAEKYLDDGETSCKKSAVVSEEGECSAVDGAGQDEADCGTFTDEEDDQSALLMLEQEDQEFAAEDNAAPEECPQQTSEKDTCESVDSSQDLPKEDHDDELTNESGDVKLESFVQNDTLPQPTESDEITVHRSNDDIARTDESTIEESKKELESEHENIPLRDILLKLKPEGLTDDEEEQSSDYSVSESNMEDESEVEEEALVSSGSQEKQEQNLDSNGTKGSTDSNGANSSGGSKKAVCSEVNATDAIDDVEVINATTLLKLLQVDPNVTSRSSSGPCYLIYFFSPYCPFSIMGSPYVNALARSVPNIPVFGLDSIEHHSVNARYGVMGTPTLLLFHNGNGVGRYNASEYSVAQLMSFIKHYTDQELTDINVTSSDFRAKLPSQLAEARPYALWAAWIFLLSFASWLFLTSELCARLTEAILNNWREAEAQNDHQD